MKFKESSEDRLVSVKSMTPEDRLWYWISDRYKLGLLKEAGNPPPWTPDPILQSYFFTWPYREKDRTTRWLKDNLRDPYDGTDYLLRSVVIFRWFNKIETGEILIERDLIEDWDSERATEVLEEYRDNGNKVFTGAYMIKAGNGPKGCKVSSVCRAIDNVLEHEEELTELCLSSNSMQKVWKRLKQFPHLGPFMSYELVCDLRYTSLLQDATDVNTWANPGPGALRGLARLHGIKPGRKTNVGDLPTSPLYDMQRLLKKSYNELKGMPRFEMREVEMSLCEFQKYEKGLFQDGKIKRRYDGQGN